MCGRFIRKGEPKKVAEFLRGKNWKGDSQFLPFLLLFLASHDLISL